MASAANMAMPVQDIDIPARGGPTEAIDQETPPGDQLALAEAGDQTADDNDGEADRRGKPWDGGDEIEQSAQRTDRRALQHRALSTMVIGEPARIAARQHGREELYADHQPDDQIAEAQFVVDEQRYDRQRQTDGKIAA
jgi:hypothetical protein